MVSRYSFFIFYFSASFLPILAWCHLVVFFKLAVKVGQIIKACLAGDFQYREIRVLQEFGCLAQVSDSGRPISVPVGDVMKGHVFNALGDCLDEPGLGRDGEQ